MSFFLALLVISAQRGGHDAQNSLQSSGQVSRGVGWPPGWLAWLNITQISLITPIINSNVTATLSQKEDLSLSLSLDIFIQHYSASSIHFYTASMVSFLATVSTLTQNNVYIPPQNDRCVQRQKSNNVHVFVSPWIKAMSDYEGGISVCQTGSRASHTPGRRQEKKSGYRKNVVYAFHWSERRVTSRRQERRFGR